MLAGEPRILVWPRVIPGPAVEAAFLDVGDVVMNQIVAQRITLVYCGPELPGLGMHRDARSIANTGCINSLARSIGIEFEDIGAICFRFVVRDVCSGAHSDVQLLAVVRKNQTASPVPAAIFIAAGNACNDSLGRTARLQVAILVGKSDDGIRIPDIDVLGTRTRRIKSK